MFARRYFPSRYYADRYWAKIGTGRGPCGCSAYGDGSLYNDGEVYCSSETFRRAYIIVRDVVFHRVAVRVQTLGRFVLDSVRLLVKPRTVKPQRYWVQVDRDEIKRASVRVQWTGCLRLDSLIPVIKVRKQQPVA